VKCARLDTPEAEGEAIAISIDNTIKSGVPARAIAVFFRTNDMSRLIEQSLAKRQIPYQVVGSGSYYDRMEVRDVLSMLRFVCNPRDGIAFHRIANKPARGMGDALIGRLESFAERHGIDLLTTLQERNLEFIRDEQDKPLSDGALRACRETRRVFDLEARGMGVGAIASALFERSRYDEWLKSRYDDKGEYEDRSRNVHELLNSISEYSRRERGGTIEDYLQSIALYTSADSDDKSENAVRLMSLHASKGLEFDVVYLIGVEHKILPHEKALADRGERGLDEERRLCYVGFTRARKILRVTWCAKRQDSYAAGKTARFKATIPSQFLVEAGLLTRDDYQKAMADAGFVPSDRPKVTAKTKQRPKVQAS
jgi:DNA helicase II / ATP-dependent DNA helicase PcrA